MELMQIRQGRRQARPGVTSEQPWGGGVGGAVTIRMFPTISITTEEIVSENEFNNCPLRPLAVSVKAKHTFAPT